MKSILGIIAAAGFSKITQKHGSTVSLKINKPYFGPKWNVTGKLINLGFPLCITNFMLESRGKRQGFDDEKPN